METIPGLRGVYAPVITPFDAALEADSWPLVKHCRWLLEQGVGLAVFGTNSEANSLSVGEKIDLLDALLDAGIPVDRLLPGTGCCALSDSVALTYHAVSHGVPGVLVLPPFFYKDVSEEGLFATYSEIIQKVADSRLRIYLYHIPQISKIGITRELIGRLLAMYPGTIAGMKDGSGDWKYMTSLIAEFGGEGFGVFAGSESVLLGTLRAGGAGCITATANVNPGPIANLYSAWQAGDADHQQSALSAIRRIFQRFPMIPALKAAVAHYADTTDWLYMRPPLVRLTSAERKSLTEELDAIGFSMPGVERQSLHLNN